MNYFNKKVRTTAIVALVLITGATISSCLKKQDNIEPEPGAVTYMVNAAPKGDSVYFYINNKRVNENILRYTNKTQTLVLAEGSHDLSLSRKTDTAKFVRKTFPFTKEKYYTIYVAPTENSVEFIQKEELTNAPTPGKVKIRFANFLYNSPKLNLHLKDVGNAFAQVAFKDITPFIEINPGTLKFQVKNAADTTQIKLDQSLSFQANTVYTIITGGNWNTTTGIASPAMWTTLY